MRDDNCEILFEYLRSILYDQEIQTPDISQLDESFQRLGKGMQVLQRMVEEMLEYSGNLAKGNLSGLHPPRDNFLCRNLKSLHANVNHLTWQAKQVTAGDYSQHVSYLGDFSEAFNTMIEQLHDREQTLREVAEREKERAVAMERYNELLMELTRRNSEWILVVEKETKKLLYCNQTQEHFEEGSCGNCWRKLEFHQQLVDWRSGDSEQVREEQDSLGHYYRIVTTEVEWQGRWAYAHIVTDITKEKQEVQLITSKAYTDPMTGIQNRRFFEENMNQLLAARSWFTLCYMDLDNLKFVNDQIGHKAGDNYIQSFVDSVKKEIRESDVFARIGGDEFCLIFKGCHENAAERKMLEILKNFRCGGDGTYEPSFSFGLIEVDINGEPLSVEEILARADAKMYEFKRAHKKQIGKK